MANLTIENNDLGSVVIEYGRFRDDLITFTAAGTYVKGTILARDTATNALVPYVKGGTTNGNGIPRRVLTYDLVADAAGDVSARSMMDGVLQKDRLVIFADGDASNVDDVVIDLMQNVGFQVLDTRELAVLDNQ